MTDQGNLTYAQALAEMTALLATAPTATFAAGERDGVEEIRRIVNAEQQRLVLLSAGDSSTQAIRDRLVSHVVAFADPKRAPFIRRGDVDSATRDVLLKGGVPRDQEGIVVRSKAGTPVSAHRNLADAITAGLIASGNKMADFETQTICRDSCRAAGHRHE